MKWVLDGKTYTLGNSLGTNGQTLNRYGAQRSISFGLNVKF